MATQLEMQTWQRDKLYSLLELRLLNKDLKIIRLNEMINEIEAKMSQEDVAWVREKIAQLYGAQ